MRAVLRMWAVALVLVASGTQADVASFYQAKAVARDVIYFDRAEVDRGTFYCGCSWTWTGRSGGRVDLASCGYQVRAQDHRAGRIEWEHVVTAWVMGHQRQCWQTGGRERCTDSDPVFRQMEADLHNLVPAIGEVNADRSNYRFGVLPATPAAHGQCDFRVDFGDRVVQPRAEVRGMIARIYFYVHDRYGLRMSQQQQQMMLAWDRQHPVTEWERLRDARIAAVMGHHNPFVTGDRQWTLGHVPGAEGLQDSVAGTVHRSGQDDRSGSVRGNQNSLIYHLAEGCPSYDRVAEHNRVEFESVAEAEAAGYRKSGNCR